MAAERWFSFNFAGPKQLDDILKKDLVEDKSATDVADIWYTYHENKVSVRGVGDWLYSYCSGAFWSI